LWEEQAVGSAREVKLLGDGDKAAQQARMEVRQVPERIGANVLLPA
jgi:hypothetical protein